MADLNLFNVKGHLKNIHCVYAQNAWWKTRQAKRLYAKTLRSYAKKTPAPSFDELLTKRLIARNNLLKERREKISIFYLGTDELQDRSGILQALDCLGELNYFTQAGGAYGHYTTGTIPQRRITNASRLLELFCQLHQEGKTPDVLIAQTFASYIDPAVFDQIRNTYGTLIINIAMDDRHQYWGRKVHGEWGGTYGLIPHIDLALTAAPECVDWYLSEGCPAIFFPEASDPEIFHPMQNLPKIHDVGFVGGCYGIREEVVKFLRGAGIRVTTFGSGWESGRIDVDSVPTFFAQSKIVLGIGTVGHSTDFYALKMRDFDGPMSGSFYITHDNPDLQLVYEVGKEIVTYQTIEKCVEKVRYYLRHDKEREAIAMAGHKRATLEHSWRKRFGVIFDLLELDKPCDLVSYATETSVGGSA